MTHKQIFTSVAALIMLALGGLVLVEAQNSPGGSFVPSTDYIVSGQWNWRNVSPWVIEGATDDDFETTITFTEPTSDGTLTIPTGVTDQFVFRASTDTLTNKTLTGATLTTPSLGKGTTRISHRQEFDEPCFKREAADYTAELVTDAAVNLAVCGGGISNFEYRLDGAQASPFVVIGGALDIDNDSAANEGVEIVLADTSASTQGWAVVGTSPAMYVRANISIASVSGTDNMYFGWKLAAAFVDQMVLETINTGGFFHINDNAGNIEIQTADDGTDADDEADANPAWTDGETITLEVRVSTAGVFTFYQDDTAVTITTATGAAAVGDVLVPVIALEQDADADTELTINWIEVGEVV